GSGPAKNRTSPLMAMMNSGQGPAGAQALASIIGGGGPQGGYGPPMPQMTGAPAMMRSMPGAAPDLANLLSAGKYSRLMRKRGRGGHERRKQPKQHAEHQQRPVGSVAGLAQVGHEGSGRAPRQEEGVQGLSRSGMGRFQPGDQPGARRHRRESPAGQSVLR